MVLCCIRYKLYCLFSYPINDAPFLGEMYFPGISVTASFSVSLVYNILKQLSVFVHIYITAKLAVRWVHEWYDAKHQQLQTVYELGDFVTVLQPKDVDHGQFTHPLCSSSSYPISSNSIIHQRPKQFLHSPVGYSISFYMYCSVKHHRHFVRTNRFYFTGNLMTSANRLG
jgi:hypothetical protein